jgi:polyisoprenyl-teichoic acid--peptidoglycan teichoic acid transferase
MPSTTRKKASWAKWRRGLPSRTPRSYADEADVRFPSVPDHDFDIETDVEVDHWQHGMDSVDDGMADAHEPAAEHDDAVDTAGLRARREPRARRSPSGAVHAIALPGVALMQASPWVGALLFAAGVVAPALVLGAILSFWSSPTELADHQRLLATTSVVMMAAVVTRFAAPWLTAGIIADPDRRRRMQRTGSIAALLIAVPAIFAVTRIEQTRAVVNDVFAASGARAAVTAPSDVLASEFHTVLLMGGDEGRGRVGLRTDTMILVMVHEPTGHTALISIPRNLEELSFRPGTALAKKFPKGFDDLANAIYATVDTDKSLRAAYSANGLDPGAVALVDTISYNMNVTIDDYALINMAGFVKLVDAVGGVTVTLGGKIPLPGQPPGSYYKTPKTIGPGEVYMDGTMALGFVRSRVADSDYERMNRQRDLIWLVSQKIGVGDVFTNFGDLTDAVRENVRTSMSIDETKRLVGSLQGSDKELESVGLTPPLIEPDEPDWTAVAKILQDTRAKLKATT